jgi:tetratricopeptide (TPR) repeat protein
VNFIPRFLFFALFLVTTLFSEGRAQSKSKPYFEFSPLAVKAYKEALSLRLGDASVSVAEMKSKEPQNYMVWLIEDYIDFFQVFIGESALDFKRLSKNKKGRLLQLSKGDRNSPYYQFCQAEVLLHWAIVRIKFNEYFTGFSEISEAFALLKENQERFPNFIENKKSLGALHAALGAIPSKYQGGLKLVTGLEGSISQGTRELKEVIAYSHTHPDFIFGDEANVMYAFLMFHLGNDSEQAWKTLQKSKLDASSNPLACFALANLAIYTGRTDEAINIIAKRPTGPNYYPLNHLDFMMGVAKLYRQDSDADKYLLKYVSEFRGQNRLKEAYQKLAWYHLTKNNLNGYKFYMKQVLTVGKTNLGSDKNAQKEAESSQLPDVNLLKARLLFDGGYYLRAKTLLLGIKRELFRNESHKLEYTYRLGRVLHKLGEFNAALSAYQTTINDGQDQGYYFAANSALQSALIYEQAKKYTKAAEYFRICEEMDPDEYNDELDSKARAGLQRIKGKK